LASQSAETAADAEKKIKEAKETMTKAKNIVVADKFAMQLAGSKLDQTLKGDEKRFALDIDGTVSELENTVKSAIPTMEEPIFSQLDHVLSDITTRLTEAKITQNQQFGVLKEGLKKIETRLRTHGGQSAEVGAVALLDTHAKAELERFTHELAALETEREFSKKQFQHLTTKGISNIETDMKARAEELKSVINRALADRASLFNEEVRKLTGSIKGLESSNSAENKELTDSNAAMRSQMGGLQDELSKLNQRETAESQNVNSEIASIMGAKTLKLQQDAARATQKAELKIKAAQASEKQKSEAEIDKSKQAIEDHLTAESERVQGNVEREGDEMRKNYQQSVDGIQSALELQKTNIDSARSTASSEYQRAQATLSDAERASKSATSEADRVHDESRKELGAAEQEAHDLAESMQQDSEHNLAIASRGLQKSRQNLSSKLGNEMKGMFDAAGDIATNGINALHSAQSMINGQAQMVTVASRAAQQSVANINTRFDAAEAESKQESDEAESKERNNQEATIDDVGQIQNTFQSAWKRNDAVLNALEESTGDMQTEGDDAKSEIGDSIEARAKAISTANQAAFAGVDSAMTNAQQKAKDNDEILKSEGIEVWKVSKKLDEHRMAYEKSTEIKVSEFKEMLAAEQKALTDNVAYLEKYNRYCHQQELDLMSRTVDILKHEAESTDSMFDKVEMETFKLAKDVQGYMQTNEYKALQKVVKTDAMIQKYSAEDKDLLSYLTQHEQRTTPWLEQVLSALDAAHDNIVLREREHTAEDLAGEAQSKAQADATVVALKSRLSGNAAAAAKELGALSSASDAARDQAMESQDGEAIGSVIAKTLTEARRQTAEQAARLGQTNADRSASATGVNGMGNDVQKLLDYNAAVVAKEKARVAQRAKGLSDAVFYGKDGAVSLTELLQRNAELTAQNKVLTGQHQEIGQEVRQALAK